MMTISEILEVLPHRYPFLLVDRVVSVVPGESLTAVKNVAINEPFFQGHFPHMPVMPGVLMVEALAQAAGILIMATEDKKFSEETMFFLGGVDKARFKRLVVPGDQLQLEVKLLKRKAGIWKFETQATVNGELACTAEIINASGN